VQGFVLVSLLIAFLVVAALFVAAWNKIIEPEEIALREVAGVEPGPGRRELERENAQLKKIVADKTLEIDMLKEEGIGAG
jgi:hypothetical protein